ncbi:MAG: YdcF family protein [Cyclobacteriaceae bacterium]
MLAFLINPLFWIILGFMFSWKKYGSSKVILFKTSVISLIIFTNPIISNLALKYWEPNPVKKDELPLSDIGIVLGGMINVDQLPKDQIHFEASADRITESISLYNSGIINKLLITGGNADLIDQEVREATILGDFVSYKIKDKDLILEVESRNTYENAVNSASILKSKNLDDRTIILITSAFHMKRSLACFDKQKINVIAYPVDYRQVEFSADIDWIIPSGESLSTWNLLFKEQIGIWMYQLAGYI